MLLHLKFEHVNFSICSRIPIFFQPIDYCRGLSIHTRNNYFPLKSCHVTCSHSLRPTCISCGNYILAHVKMKQGVLYSSKILILHFLPHHLPLIKQAMPCCEFNSFNVGQFHTLHVDHIQFRTNIHIMSCVSQNDKVRAHTNVGHVCR